MNPEPTPRTAPLGGALGIGMLRKNCQKGSFGFTCGSCGCSWLTFRLPLTLMFTTAGP